MMIKTILINEPSKNNLDEKRKTAVKYSSKIYALLVAVTILIVLVVAGSFLAFSQIVKEGAARKQTYILISKANGLLSEIKDAETSQRGYLLTGNETFLEPYQSVKSTIPIRNDELRQIWTLSNNKKQLDTIIPLVDKMLAHITQVIELRRNSDLPAALASVRSGQGRVMMDSIRAGMNNFIKIEENALENHDAEFQSNIRYLFSLIVVSSMLMLMLALLFAYLIYSESEKRHTKAVYLETQHLLKIREETNKELEHANLSLRIIEENLSVTLNSIGDAVMATDATGRITLLNPVAEEMTGWTLDEAIGFPVEHIFHIIDHETRQPSLIPVKETLAHGTIQGLANHTILISRNGNECAIADSCAPIRDRDNQVIGAVLVFRDVTERTEIEEGLKKAHKELQAVTEELKRSAMAKSEFLANISHELRTPLNSINGFSEILYDETFGVLNEKQKVYVNNILTSGYHLLQLINQILDTAKVEAGKMKLSISVVPIKKLLFDISLLVADMVSKKKIDMALEIAADLPDIEADELKVKEIIYNLLSNAVKFTPDGRKIGMRAKKAKSNIEIVVWDSGVGIAPENLGKVFEGFFRVDTPYSRLIEGTGLGLPLSKKLVELHGGMFSLVSAGLDKGTSVLFTLPIIAREEV